MTILFSIMLKYMIIQTTAEHPFTIQQTGFQEQASTLRLNLAQSGGGGSKHGMPLILPRNPDGHQETALPIFWVKIALPFSHPQHQFSQMSLTMNAVGHRVLSG